MSSEGSITRWIDRLQAGDPAAAQPLWKHYFHLLVELARRKLGAKPRVADQEDVALERLRQFLPGTRARPLSRPKGPRQPLEAAGRLDRSQGVSRAPVMSKGSNVAAVRRPAPHRSWNSW